MLGNKSPHNEARPEATSAAADRLHITLEPAAASLLQALEWSYGSLEDQPALDMPANSHEFALPSEAAAPAATPQAEVMTPVDATQTLDLDQIRRTIGEL